MNWGIFLLVVIGVFGLMLVFSIIFDKVIKPRIIEKRKNQRKE